MSYLTVGGEGCALQHGKTMAHIIGYLLGKSGKKMKPNGLFEQEREENMKR